MNPTNRTLISAVLRSTEELLILTTATVAVPLIVYLDSVVLGNGVTEYSATEIIQETLLLFSAAIFLLAAIRHAESRGFLILVCGFFTCMLIRELDFLFDMIHQGAWVYPAIVVAACSIAVAATYHRTVLGPMVAYSGSKSWIDVTIGLLIVLVLSRLFGSGRLIWDAVMGTEYKTAYKAIIQEGLELYGYMFVFYGSWLVPQQR
jgi:hypothetical protein